jgi:hypothetical protein
MNLGQFSAKIVVHLSELMIVPVAVWKQLFLIHGSLKRSKYVLRKEALFGADNS